MVGFTLRRVWLSVPYTVFSFI